MLGPYAVLGSGTLTLTPTLTLSTPNQEVFDPYAVLGLARTASALEIKQAYRKAALQWHPDKAPTLTTPTLPLTLTLTLILTPTPSLTLTLTLTRRASAAAARRRKRRRRDASSLSAVPTLCFKPC